MSAGGCTTGDREIAIQVNVFTRVGTTAVVRYALELARSRQGRLTSATKSNGIMYAMPFWDEVVRDVAAEYPDVAVETMHLDALLARLVRDPARFDVIVGSNLFGDLLTDLSAALMGSIGIAPSANIDPTGTNPSLFEPVHGSAPDIAGQGIANPIGQVWTGALMLRHLGFPAAAERIEAAIGAVDHRGRADPGHGRHADDDPGRRAPDRPARERAHLTLRGPADRGVPSRSVRPT